MANERFTHAIYGEMCGIDEASRLTSIPKGTLRLWRRPAYHHLARFRFLTIDNRVWYPLSEIRIYQEKNGIDPNGYRTAIEFDGSMFAHLPPPITVDRVDPREQENLATLNAITKATWMSNGTQPAGMNWKLATEFEDEWREACKIALTEFVDRFKPEEDPFDLDTGSVGGIHWTPRAWDKLSPTEQSKHRMRYDFVNTLAARIIYNKNFDLGIDLSRVIKTEVI